MAACCDYLIGSTKAQFGLPQIWMGGLGGGGHAFRIFPQGLARSMQYTGEYIDAERAYQVGALNELVEPSKLMARAMEEAKKLATKLPAGTKAAKEALNLMELAMPDIKMAHKIEQPVMARMRGSEDQQEARAAWLEHREPKFSDD